MLRNRGESLDPIPRIGAAARRLQRPAGVGGRQLSRSLTAEQGGA